MAKILIVEDNADTNEALSEYLQEAGHEVISAFDGTEALEFFSDNTVDLIVLDIMLPTMSGLAVLNAVRKTSQIPVIMLTALEDEYTQVSSFDCLADDYMTKPFSMVVLGKRITALLRRAGIKDEPDIWEYGDLIIDFSGYSACNQNGKVDVTPKELDLLKVLVEHKGLVLSRSQILNAVWGDNSFVIDRIVDSYIRNLRKKLKLDCIVTVKGIGYKLEVDT